MENKRHKCSICGRVRSEYSKSTWYEDKKKQMEILTYKGGYPKKTRYGNECWICVDNPDCQQMKDKFFPY